MSKIRRKRRLHQPPAELARALAMPAARRKLSGNRVRPQTLAEAKRDWLAGIMARREVR